MPKSGRTFLLNTSVLLSKANGSWEYWSKEEVPKSSGLVIISQYNNKSIIAQRYREVSTVIN
jgi:hypothetical protein